MILADQLYSFFKKLEEDQIEFDPTDETASTLSKATFAVKGQARALIKPVSQEDITTVLKRADEFKVPIYPVSQGKNWGYGSAAPPEEAVILSLKKLNKIIDFDSESGVVTLESGVTFNQVQHFLVEQNSRWQLNAPGSTTEASVVANMLSRGLIQGPSPEKWRDVIALKVLLATGDTIDTDVESTATAYRSTGTGPDLLPLFFQSNLGIITEMKLKLDYRPKFWQHLHITWKEAKCPVNLVLDVCKTLVKEDTIAASISMHSAEKILSVIHKYPYEASKRRTPLPKELRKKMLEEIGGGDWFLETAIAAPSEQILDCKRTFVNEAIKSLPVELNWSDPNEVGPIFHYKTETAPEQMYWRKASNFTEIKPEQDGCGVLWISPVIPWDNDKIYELFEQTQAITHSKGFETLVTFQFLNDSYVYAIISLLYDRNVSGEDQNALSAFESIRAFLKSRGYRTYRLSLLEQPLDLEGDDVRCKLKRLLDPNNIIAPGFYIRS